jgi:AcrR family transcriptional regulator
MGGAVPPRADAVRNRARILDAAARVFAAGGAGASTEEVAAAAGVAVGTVFRHFPTKTDLLVAIMKDALEQFRARAAAPGATLFDVFADLVREAGDKRSVIELLPSVGLEDTLAGLRDDLAALLTRAQADGSVRPEIRIDEVMALLLAACEGAMRAGWDADLRDRTLRIVFTGLRP